MELAFGVVFVLVIALIVAALGLLVGRGLASKFERLADETDDRRVPEDE
jgi:hypothetical protein